MSRAYIIERRNDAITAIRETPEAPEFRIGDTVAIGPFHKVGTITAIRETDQAGEHLLNVRVPMRDFPLLVRPSETQKI